MKLTPHEEKILSLVKSNPGIVTNSKARAKVAKEHGLSEKTLRNRIGDLKKYGLLEANTNVIKKINNQNIINENDEVDVLAVWKTLMNQKSLIFFVTSLFTISGIIYGIFATPYYQSTVSLYPAGEIGEVNSILGDNLIGIAESFGIGSAPTYNIPDIINSRRLKKDIVLKTWNNSLFLTGSNLIKYWEIDKSKWFDLGNWIKKYLPHDQFQANPEQKFTEKAIEKLSELITVEEEISGLITVSVLMEDPQIASDIANYITEFVKEFIKYEQHREDVRNKKFIFTQQLTAKEELASSEQLLTEFYKKNPLPQGNPELRLIEGRLIRNVEEKQAVYITLRQQFEIAKIEEAKENLLVNILDIAEPAVEKEKPKRKLIVLLALMIGLVVSCAWVSINNVTTINNINE